MKTMATVGPNHKPWICHFNLNTQISEIGIPKAQYPTIVMVDANPCYPRPLITPTPTPCMQSKNTNTDSNG